MKYLTLLFVICSFTCFSQKVEQAEPVKLPDFNRFEKVRATGKFMQLFGTAGMFTYFLLQKKYNDRIDSGDLRAKRPSGAIPIVSTGFIGVGLCVDITAGVHLKRK